MITIGTVGCGYWGPNLIRNFNSLRQCEVKKICDCDSQRLNQMHSQFPHVDVTKIYDEIINDDSIDAIVIATPVRYHYEMALKSLNAGKHTFIEKPMASSAAECRELVDIAEKNKLTLMVGHTFVYSCPVRKIKEIINRGDLGEIQYIASRRLNLGLFQKDINVAWDLAPHDISIILYIMEEMPRSVSCQGKTHGIPNIEDVITMTLNFSNGGFAMIHNSWLDPNKVREMTFVGKDKMLVYNDIELIEKIKIYDKCVKIPPHYETFGEFQYSYHYGDMYCPYLKQVEPLKVECQHFLECIETGTSPISDGRNGLKVVQILEAATRSLRNGGGSIHTFQ